MAAGGERGPKIAAGKGTLYAAWQGDYRQGPKVWFARSLDGGSSFESQRDLLDGKTPGIDQVAVAAMGDEVVVLWLDGRGGQDASAPVTSTIWYCLSLDGGKSFGPNREIEAVPAIRACACCSFDAKFTSASEIKIVFRSGIGNARDIWSADGDPRADKWTAKPLTHTNWNYQGCPMDGPRFSGEHVACTIDGKCYLDSHLLGPGKYAAVGAGVVLWQNAGTICWRSIDGADSGSIRTGVSRCALLEGPRGEPLVIH